MELFNRGGFGSPFQGRKSSWFSFGAERQDIIAPYMNMYDKSRLYSMITADIDRYCSQGNEYIKKAAAALGKTDEQIVTLIKQAVPAHLVADINSMFYHKSNQQEFCKIDGTNKPKLDLLTSINDARSKTVTNNNYFNSNLFAKEITAGVVKSIVEALTGEEIEDLANGMNNSGDGDSDVEIDPNSPFGKAIQKLLDAKDSNGNSKLDENVRLAKGRAFRKINDLKDSGIDTNDLEEKYGKDASKMIGDIDKIRSEAQQVSFNKAALKPIIHNIIDKSTNFFSRRYTTKEISIFDAENFDTFDGLENLHPIFKQAMLEEVVTKENRYYGKMRVYVDVSGSMDSNINCDGQQVPAIVFAKALLLELHSQHLITKIVPFGSNLKTPLDPVTGIDILFLNAYCGTDLSKVVEDCEKSQENALIITDGCDTISKNSPYSFFIGTPGASFDLKNGAEIMRENGQVWTFNEDGTNVVKC